MSPKFVDAHGNVGVSTLTILRSTLASGVQPIDSLHLLGKAPLLAIELALSVGGESVSQVDLAVGNLGLLTDLSFIVVVS